MLKIRSRMIPYVLATAIAAGGAATSLKAQNDRFIKTEETTEALSEQNSSDRNHKWVNFWEIVGLATMAGIFKLADYIEKKENKEDEKESKVNADLNKDAE